MWTRDNSSESSKTAPIAQPITPPLPAEERRVVAWVGKSVIFEGTLTSSEDMTIDGQVRGTIELRDHGLTVGPDADIRADIVAQSVTIHGTVTGTVRASAKVDIRETGRINGDLFTPRVAMADGAIVRGRVDTLSDQSDAAAKRARLAIA
jgi:cytoskeletal protein CcmA (bactofilin family)